MVSNNPYKCKESYSNWDVCYHSLVSSSEIHMVGTSRKDTKIQKEWQFKSIQAPAFVNPPRKAKHYKTSSNDDQNNEKIGTVFITTDIKGRDKKEKTVKQKK